MVRVTRVDRLIALDQAYAIAQLEKMGVTVSNAECCPMCQGTEIQFQRVLHLANVSGEIWYCKDCDSNFVANFKEKQRRLGGAPDASGSVLLDEIQKKTVWDEDRFKDKHTGE